MPPLPRERDRGQRKEALDKFHGAMTRAVNSPRFKKALEDFEENLTRRSGIRRDSLRAAAWSFLKRRRSKWSSRREATAGAGGCASGGGAGTSACASTSGLTDRDTD
jgi:hypothetical protein